MIVFCCLTFNIFSFSTQRVAQNVFKCADVYTVLLEFMIVLFNSIFQCPDALREAAKFPKLPHVFQHSQNDRKLTSMAQYHVEVVRCTMEI